jgi:hypothetical protein
MTEMREGAAHEVSGVYLSRFLRPRLIGEVYFITPGTIPVKG